jgi:hypothetical protein
VPRLVLFEDDGREVFAGEISRANFAALEGFLARHRPVITSGLAVFGVARGLLGLVAERDPRRLAPAAPRVLPRKPAPRKRGGRV